MSAHRRRRPLLRLLLLAALASPGAARAGEPDGCYQVYVPEPFVLPDGSDHPPAMLRICGRHQLSPVAWLHAAYLDGMPLGGFLAKVEPAAAALGSGEARIVFRRDVEGELHLDGLAFAAARGSRVHRFLPSGQTGLARARADEVSLIARRY